MNVGVVNVGVFFVPQTHSGKLAVMWYTSLHVFVVCCALAVHIINYFLLHIYVCIYRI